MSEKAKWTPGPWSIRHARDTSGDVGITAPNVGNVIAETFADMRFEGERNNSEALANAHLIAAAPAMAEALEPFANISIGDGEDTGSGWDATQATILIRHIKAARAALALAHGESK